MSIAKEHRAIETALDNYRERLDTISDELFTETPSGGGWSSAEAYSHVMKATLSSLIAMERCAHSNCPPTTQGLSMQGRFVLLFGCFPPVKIKSPDGMTAEKISKEDARNLIIKCRKRIEVTMPLIANAPADVRYKHPRLGMLNARQWFRFTRIHLQHHLKQLEQIKRNFA
ncbi:MAG TPA: DinB family protein [Mucilaginibacter sp.]|nr:DinB family protein [Mucilaginibacter sp.]